jgi:hypothetical protein
MSSRVLRFTPEQHADYERRRAQAIGIGNAELVTLTPAKLRSIPTPESLVVKAVLAALKLHAGVAWAQRMNVVSQRIDQRYVRAGFVGLSDIIGQMTDGRFLAIECKSSTGRLTDNQAAFLDTVRRHGGVAFMARAVDDVWHALWMTYGGS